MYSPVGSKTKLGLLGALVGDGCVAGGALVAIAEPVRHVVRPQQVIEPFKTTKIAEL